MFASVSAVRTEDAEDLSLDGMQAQILHRDDVPIVPSDVHSLDRGPSRRWDGRRGLRQDRRSVGVHSRTVSPVDECRRAAHGVVRETDPTPTLSSSRGSPRSEARCRCGTPFAAPERPISWSRITTTPAAIPGA